MVFRTIISIPELISNIESSLELWANDIDEEATVNEIHVISSIRQMR